MQADLQYRINAAIDPTAYQSFTAWDKSADALAIIAATDWRDDNASCEAEVELGKIREDAGQAYWETLPDTYAGQLRYDDANIIAISETDLCDRLNAAALQVAA